MSVFQGCGVVRFYNHNYDCYIAAEGSFVGKSCEISVGSRGKFKSESEDCMIQKNGNSICSIGIIILFVLCVLFKSTTEERERSQGLETLHLLHQMSFGRLKLLGIPAVVRK